MVINIVTGQTHTYTPHTTKTAILMASTYYRMEGDMRLLTDIWIQPMENNTITTK